MNSTYKHDWIWLIRSVVVAQLCYFLEVLPVPLRQRVHILDIWPLYPVCGPMLCQYVVLPCFLELRRCQIWHLMLINYIYNLWCTLWQHDLFYIEVVLVEGPITGCNYLQSPLNLMAIQLNEQPTMRNMVWRYMPVEPPIIIVSKWLVIGGPKEPRITIHAFKDRVIRLLVDVIEDFPHCHCCIAWILNASLTNLIQRWWFLQNICHSGLIPEIDLPFPGLFLFELFFNIFEVGFPSWIVEIGDWIIFRLVHSTHIYFAIQLERDLHLL